MPMSENGEKMTKVKRGCPRGVKKPANIHM